MNWPLRRNGTLQTGQSDADFFMDSAMHELSSNRNGLHKRATASRWKGRWMWTRKEKYQTRTHLQKTWLQESDTAEFRRLQLHKLTIEYEKNCGDKQYIIANGRDLKIKFLCCLHRKLSNAWGWYGRTRDWWRRGMWYQMGHLSSVPIFSRLAKSAMATAGGGRLLNFGAATTRAKGKGKRTGGQRGFVLSRLCLLAFPRLYLSGVQVVAATSGPATFFVFMLRELLLSYGLIWWDQMFDNFLFIYYVKI